MAPVAALVALATAISVVSAPSNYTGAVHGFPTGKGLTDLGGFRLDEAWWAASSPAVRAGFWLPQNGTERIVSASIGRSTATGLHTHILLLYKA